MSEIGNPVEIVEQVALETAPVVEPPEGYGNLVAVGAYSRMSVDYDPGNVFEDAGRRYVGFNGLSFFAKGQEYIQNGFVFRRFGTAVDSEGPPSMPMRMPEAFLCGDLEKISAVLQLRDAAWKQCQQATRKMAWAAPFEGMLVELGRTPIGAMRWFLLQGENRRQPMLLPASSEARCYRKNEHIATESFKSVTHAARLAWLHRASRHVIAPGGGDQTLLFIPARLFDSEEIAVKLPQIEGVWDVTEFPASQPIGSVLRTVSLRGWFAGDIVFARE